MVGLPLGQRAGRSLGCRGDRHVEGERFGAGVIVCGIAFEGERNRRQAMLRHTFVTTTLDAGVDLRPG